MNDCYEGQPGLDGARMITTRAETPTHIAPTMRTFLCSFALCLALGSAFCFALSSTLDDMTKRDCQFGSVRACVQLKQAGLL